MSFEKPAIPPRRRLEVSEEARQQVRAGMGGEAIRPVPAPPAPLAPLAAPAAVEAGGALAAPPAAPVAASPGRAAPRGRQPAGAGAPEGAVPLHTVQLAKAVVQAIKLNLLLATPGPGTPTTIKQYLEAAHRHYEAHLRKTGQLPPA